jgi:hypothetical protein
MPKAAKCAQSAPHAKAVTVAANGVIAGVNAQVKAAVSVAAFAQVKAAVSVASALSAARAMPPMPTRLNQLWA